MIIGLAILVSICGRGWPARAQDGEAADAESESDQEIIAVMDLLDQMDLLEEDPGLLEQLPDMESDGDTNGDSE